MKSLLTLAIVALSIFYCKAQVWQAVNSMNNITYGLQVRNDTVIASGMGILSISFDDGNTWTSKIAGLPVNPLVRDVLWVNNKLFATILYQGIWVSNNLGQSWQLFDGTTVPSNGPTEMGTDGTSLFIADVNGFLWKTPLNSANLTKVLTVNGQVTDIAIDASGKIYVSTALNGVYTSSDHGATFTQISNGLPQISPTLYTEVQTIATNGAGDIYAAVNNKGVFKYNTSNTTWQAKNNGIDEIADNIGTAYRGLLAVGNNVLLGTANGNVYVSTNKAESFTNISANEFVPTYKVALSSDRIFVSGNSVRYRPIGGLLGTTAAKEALRNQAVKFYPNPVHDRLEVKMNNFNDDAEIDIVDYLGRTVMIKEINSLGEFSLDVSSLASGLYAFRIMKDGSLISSEKFIKN